MDRLGTCEIPIASVRRTAGKRVGRLTNRPGPIGRLPGPIGASDEDTERGE
jgi:hypothetical protein